MSYPELNHLTRAEELFEAGKLDKALEILNDESQFEELNPKQKSYFQFLKGLILIYQNKSEEVIELGEQIFKEGQKLKENLQSFDGFFFILFGLVIANKFEEANKKVEKAEVLLGFISNASNSIILQREVRLNVLKSFINFNIGRIDLAEKYLEEPLKLQAEFGNIFELVWANTIMAQILFQIKKKPMFAMEYVEKAFSIAKEMKYNHFWLGYCHIGFGVVYSVICEYEMGFKHFMKSLAIFKEINNNYLVALLLNNIATIHYYKAEYDLALKCFEECLILFEQIPVSIFNIEGPIDGLISAALAKGDTDLAQKCFERLENMYNQKKDRRLEVIYQFNKALMLKRSSRIRDKAEAEELLKKIVKKETISFEHILYAYINLCDLLLTEFRINYNSEVLDELNHYIAKLLTLAENSHSYLVFCETFILQAKLALLNFNIKAARLFLTQAQRIAEKQGIKRLAMKISQEHDEILRQIDTWERFKDKDASIADRWEFAGLTEHMENMVKKRMIESSKITEEDPVSILIITEGGSALFSHSFIDQKSFDSQIFGGFLTTIDYFIREMFSEGLDRAIFGEYTLLMKFIEPFFISYIFKGSSYYAIQKINGFIEKLKKEEFVWQKLLKSFQINQTLKIKDIPLIESIIREIFVKPNLVNSKS
ncbi:MAG: hypothetical protein ACFE8L_09925 [Candidatus Hodarchaeota archaeon]